MEMTSGTPDVAQLQAIMHAIELACSSIQINVNPAAAEATILSLSRSPRPYQACQFILENSQMANARFQAAAAIRDAAIREWVFLTADEKRGLISFCLCFMLQHASSPEGYVQAKVSSVASQLLKRGWVDFTAAEKEAFLYQVNQAISGCHGLDVQYRGINFLESLVSEFLPSTSTALGLPREFHEQCRNSLEQDYLKVVSHCFSCAGKGDYSFVKIVNNVLLCFPAKVGDMTSMTFYCWAQDAAFSVTRKIMESASTVPEANVCTAAMRLMLQILNWDFRYNSNGHKSSKVGIDVYSAEVKYEIARRSDCVLVQPGPSWRDILVTNGQVGWLLNLYGVLRQKFSCEGYWLDCPIAVSARKLIVQFCSLSGSVFPTDNGQMQEKHLLLLLSGIIQWISPPDAVSKAIECGKSESEMLDGCRALLAIATVTTPLVFDGLLKSVSSFGTVTLLSSLMCEVIKVLMANYTDEETWSWVARDILLDTWTSLLVPMDNSGQSSLLSSEGINASANLFALIVESELKAASASVTDEECGSEYLQASISAMDERLSSYALIARAGIDFTVPLLTRLFSERLARLHQTGANDPIETLEELYSLLLLAGHVLADEGEGEVPSVPKSIQAHFTDITELEKHPVIVLSCSILRFAEQSLDPEMRTSVFSPRLMEAVIWFIARWSRTYLMSHEESKGNRYLQSEQSTKAWLSYFKEGFQGKFVLEIIVRISQMTLVSYPGEKELQALTCYHLLNGMVRTKNICQHIVTLDSWRDLAKAFATEGMLFSLHGAHQRSLAQTLTLAASGMSLEASNQYLKDLMSPTIASLSEVSNKNDLKKIAQQPDVLHFVSCLLERLRGAAGAAEPRIQKAIYEMGMSVMHPVQIFLEVYKNESAVVYLLLKFVVDWVDGQITYLEAQETASVVNFCMGLLQLYSSYNIGKISISHSNNLLSEAETEKYKDLRALLQLLSSLCSKDLVDFSSESIETQGTNISQVVFFGLHIVTPLITTDLLKYPKLCHDYFSLLSHMLEVYPEMVAQLNTNAFGHILGTLDFGLHHQDTEVVDMCLRSLKALAAYHYKEVLGGKVGLGSKSTSYNDTDGRLQDGILSPFLRLLLQFLLFEDYSTDLTSAAADALLPLILCEQGLYQATYAFHHKTRQRLFQLLRHKKLLDFSKIIFLYNSTSHSSGKPIQRLGNELLEKQANPTFKSRLANALQSLTSSNNLSASLDRANYQRFRKNLNNFLVEVRGFLRTM